MMLYGWMDAIVTYCDIRFYSKLNSKAPQYSGWTSFILIEIWVLVAEVKCVPPGDVIMLSLFVIASGSEAG